MNETARMFVMVMATVAVVLVLFLLCVYIRDMRRERQWESDMDDLMSAYDLQLESMRERLKSLERRFENAEE